MLTRFARVLPIIGALLPSAPARADRVDDEVRREMARQHIPGVAVAIVRDGKAVKTKGYGYANLEHRVPVTADTLFQIQSVTKPFTATAVLMLAEEGRLALEDPIGRHLEGVPDAWSGITLRHLLSHTSGLKDYINEPTQSLRLDVSDEDVLRAEAARPVNFAPGDRYQYSNTNYLLLGMVIRKTSGKGYADFLADRVFRPLKMEATRAYSWDDVIPARAAGYLRRGDRWVNGQFIAPSVLSYPGGGLLSSARDMARWDIGLSTGGLLRPETMREMWSPTRLTGGGRSGYGLGWSTGVINGHPHQDHNGRHHSGFASTILRFPQDRLSVIVLANLAGADTHGLARQIAATTIPALKPDPPPEP